MDSSYWLSTAGGESWESLKDFVNSMGSVAKLPGKANGVVPTFSTENNNSQINSSLSKKKNTPENTETKENSVMLLPAERDASLLKELNLIGTDYSNATIEKCWGSYGDASSSSVEPDSDTPSYNSTEGRNSKNYNHCQGRNNQNWNDNSSFHSSLDSFEFMRGSGSVKADPLDESSNIKFNKVSFKKNSKSSSINSSSPTKVDEICHSQEITTEGKSNKPKLRKCRNALLLSLLESQKSQKEECKGEASTETSEEAELLEDEEKEDFSLPAFVNINPPHPFSLFYEDVGDDYQKFVPDWQKNTPDQFCMNPKDFPSLKS